MKALTLHQPWASLVAYGLKQIETRSWSTKHRGQLAIHAGKRQAPYEEWPAEALKLWPHYPDLLGSLPLGAVVAVVNLVDVVPAESLRFHRGIGGGWTTGRRADDYVAHAREAEMGDLSAGRFAWLLRYDVQRFEQPIPAAGRQGLWTWQL